MDQFIGRFITHTRADTRTSFPVFTEQADDPVGRIPLMVSVEKGAIRGVTADRVIVTQEVARQIVERRGISPDKVGYVNAHGTSTPIGDTLEAHAIRNFFGDHKLAVSSTKSMTGHLLGGAGGLEAGITVLALRDQVLPPTINLENQDPDTGAMDFVPNQSRKAGIEYAMSNSFGFGGTNGALLFRRWSE